MIADLLQQIKRALANLPWFELQPPRRLHGFQWSKYNSAEEALQADWKAILQPTAKERPRQ